MQGMRYKVAVLGLFGVISQAYATGVRFSITDTGSGSTRDLACQRAKANAKTSIEIRCEQHYGQASLSEWRFSSCQSDWNSEKSRFDAEVHASAVCSRN